jgi:hypothetical protein
LWTIFRFTISLRAQAGIEITHYELNSIGIENFAGREEGSNLNGQIGLRGCAANTGRLPMACSMQCHSIPGINARPDAKFGKAANAV